MKLLLFIKTFRIIDPNIYGSSVSYWWILAAKLFSLMEVNNSKVPYDMLIESEIVLAVQNLAGPWEKKVYI